MRELQDSRNVTGYKHVYMLCIFIILNIYLTFGNEKNGMATIIKSRPMSRNPNHHSPMNRLSDGSIFVKNKNMMYSWKLEHYINVPLWIFLAVIDPLLFVGFHHALMELWMESIIYYFMCDEIWTMEEIRWQLWSFEAEEVEWFWKFLMKFDSVH